MKTIYTALYVAVLSALCISEGYSQILNGDFELWEDSLEYKEPYETFIDSAIQTIPLEWDREEFQPIYGYYRTTDSYTGEYAAVIYTWYSYVNTTLSQTNPISSKPDFLSGHYKYYPASIFGMQNDSAEVKIQIFDKLGNEIGSGLGYLDSTHVYTEFQIPITYMSDEEAYEFSLEIKNATTGCKLFDGQCLYLFIDNLNFGNSTSTTSFQYNKKIFAYPNPSEGFVRFSTLPKQVDILNAEGRLVKTYFNTPQIQMPEPSGVYILRMTDSENEISIQRLIKL